jgi:uncharacterized SAM-binding protein YcdF (DUF218 family)
VAFKKLISACLLPFPLALLLLLGGLILLWFTQRQRLGRILASASALMFLVLGYDLVSRPLIAPLERPYAPLAPAAVAALSPPPAAIVVLGSGFRPDPGVPPNDRLSGNGILRLVEAVRLARLVPAARLIVSDGLGQGQALADTAVMLGVERRRIAVEPLSFDTADEAALLPPLVGDAPFLLVTSALHMRRATALCRKQGLHPIPAPTDFVLGPRLWTGGELVPNTTGFFRVEISLHEWLGYWWSRLRGKI